MQFDVLTLFPEMFEPIKQSIIGKAEEKKENARKMKVLGLSNEMIHQVTGLSVEEIETLLNTR